ncbi:hypothetical protein E4T47_00449 [Aureobasidium subglaciale]|nr:hypothetical protein E4T47_00449 [Aureobasidium subglaciale]
MTFMPITNTKVHFMQFFQHGVLASSQHKSEDTPAALLFLHSFHSTHSSALHQERSPGSLSFQPFQHGVPVPFHNKREDTPAALPSHTFVSHPHNHQHYTKRERQKQATEGTYEEKKGFLGQNTSTCLPACLPALCSVAPEKRFPRRLHHFPLHQLPQENQVVFSSEKMETRENVSTNLLVS